MSYNEKHNETNGEGSNDGESHNRSWNCGVEGETTDQAINALRPSSATQLHHHADGQPGGADAGARRRARPYPARQQQCLRPGQRALLGSTGTSRPIRRICWPSPRRPSRSARRHPVLRRRRFFAGDASMAARARSATSSGSSPTVHDGRGRLELRLCPQRDGFLNGDAIPEPDQMGRRITDDHFLLMFNAHSEPISSPFRRRSSATSGRSAEHLLPAWSIRRRKGPDGLPIRPIWWRALDGGAVHHGRAPEGVPRRSRALTRRAPQSPSPPPNLPRRRREPHRRTNGQADGRLLRVAVASVRFRLAG